MPLLVAVVLLLGCFGWALLGLYARRTGFGGKNWDESAGTFGDSFGGINALLSLFGVVMLCLTIKLTLDALREQRREMKLTQSIADEQRNHLRAEQALDHLYRMFELARVERDRWVSSSTGWQDEKQDIWNRCSRAATSGGNAIESCRDPRQLLAIRKEVEEAMTYAFAFIEHAHTYISLLSVLSVAIDEVNSLNLDSANRSAEAIRSLAFQEEANAFYELSLFLPATHGSQASIFGRKLTPSGDAPPVSKLVEQINHRHGNLWDIARKVLEKAKHNGLKGYEDTYAVTGRVVGRSDV